MVKEFLKCNSIRERIQFLANTVLKDWDASELDTVMDIMGLSKEGMEAPEDKISAIEKYLELKKKETENREDIVYRSAENFSMQTAQDDKTTWG